MITKDDFLKKYSIDEEVFESSKLDWADLEKIFSHYSNCMNNFLPTANYASECLRQIPEVHSLKMRIKEPEHLIEKIIRKKIEDNLDITLDNYRSKITDLIGIRVLHLFKEDWGSIHDFIVHKWDIIEEPVANIRKGDPDSFIERFSGRGCAIREHPLGYRSVHYLAQSKPGKETHIIEIQVRKIFEEGWSEIDHRTRYPYEVDNVILNQFSVIFNRLAGSSDEMGSFVRFLKSELDRITLEASKNIEEKDNVIQSLKTQIKSLKIEKSQQKQLEESLNTLSGISISGIGISPSSFSASPDLVNTIGGVTITRQMIDMDSSSYGSGSFIGKSWQDIKRPDPSPIIPPMASASAKSKPTRKRNIIRRIMDWIKSRSL